MIIEKNIRGILNPEGVTWEICQFDKLITRVLFFICNHIIPLRLLVCGCSFPKNFLDIAH